MSALEINVFAGVNFAGFANGGGIGIRVACFAHLLGNFELNRQAVTIPTRNVGRAFAAQGLILDDDVLENLVQRGADVDVTIGKRRAVVQDKFLGAGAGGLNFFVELGGLPFFQTFGFARDEVGLHGKVRARQIQCVFIFHVKIERKR